MGFKAVVLESKSVEYLSVDEFSLESGLSQATIRRYIRNGKLPAIQPAGKRCRVLIPRNALEFLAVGPDVNPALHSNEKQNSDSPRLPGPSPSWRSNPLVTRK